MDHLQAMEIPFLQKLQHTFGDHRETMLLLSRLGDPRSAFTVCVPLVYCLSRSTGLKVLWAAVTSEWLNLILKWLLNGNRPYWWVQESNMYEDGNRPIIKQFRLSCETGPGIPSGHVMVTTAVWFIMMSSLTTLLATCRPATNGKSQFLWLLSKLPYLFLAALASVISVSRVFIATHFMHQVLLGFVVGIIVGMFISRLDVETFKTSTSIIFAIVIVAGALIQFYVMTALNFDLSWSITLALRRCEQKEWVHLDTTPLYGLARDFGSLTFGSVADRVLSARDNSSTGRRVSAAVTSLLLTQIIEMIKIPSENVNIFYALGLVKYGVMIAGTVVVKHLYSSRVKSKCS